MKVVIKWGKKTFDDVEIDTSLPASVFKHQVYSLTGVPPERQKIMVKGGMLKDESSWSDTGVKSGQKLMLLGTADKLPEAPMSAPTFLEDLPEEQQVRQERQAPACVSSVQTLPCDSRSACKAKGISSFPQLCHFS